MSKELKKGSYLAQFSGSRLPPRDILQKFFKTNMEMITKMSVKKSIGDYGQEHVASCKFGSDNFIQILHMKQLLVHLFQFHKKKFYDLNIQRYVSILPVCEH